MRREQKKNEPSDSYLVIWQSVTKIPRGKVATYGGIARISGLARRARQVGYALHNLPHNVEVPWHRVINAQGRISLPKTGGHYDRQRELLETEGIVFTRGSIDLKRYGWTKSESRGERHAKRRR